MDSLMSVYDSHIWSCGYEFFSDLELSLDRRGWISLHELMKSFSPWIRIYKIIYQFSWYCTPDFQFQKTNERFLSWPWFALHKHQGCCHPMNLNLNAQFVGIWLFREQHILYIFLFSLFCLVRIGIYPLRQASPLGWPRSLCPVTSVPALRHDHRSLFIAFSRHSIFHVFQVCSHNFQVEGQFTRILQTNFNFFLQILQFAGILPVKLLSPRVISWLIYLWL